MNDTNHGIVFVIKDGRVRADFVVGEMNALQAEIDRLRAERDDYKARYETALLDGTDESTAPNEGE